MLGELGEPCHEVDGKISDDQRLDDERTCMLTSDGGQLAPKKRWYRRRSRLDEAHAEVPRIIEGFH